MANIFAAITAVLLLASAFVAFKNQKNFEAEVEDSKIEMSRLTTSRDTLSKLQADRKATIEDRTGVEEDTLAKQEVEAERTAANKKFEGDIETKSSQVSRNAKEISEIEEQTKELGEIRDLADKVERMKTTIAGLEDDKADKSARLANLLGQKSSTEGTIEGFREIDEAFSKQRSYFESARISAIFAPWGFVTIDAGNSGGAITQSVLDVVRDGEVIAKLRIRSVESSRSAADIIPDSMVEDVTLMVGDKVVPSASAEAPAPAADPASEMVNDQAPPPPPVEEKEEDPLDFDFDL